MITDAQICASRILVIDDQKLHALFLREVLTEAGYRNVSYVLDPVKALSVVREIRPDLIILDLLMPKVDGFQILAQLEEDRRRHYLPVLALSADPASEIRLRALQAGATDFLSKPFESLEIVIHVRNLVEMRLLHQAVEEQNRFLEQKVRERTKALRESQLDIIRRLAHAAEFRDNDTGRHIIRMSHYCAVLARRVGGNQETCERILNASPLHDVGKIGIPDHILLKEGPLTEEEYEVMKTHTLIGAQILEGGNSEMMRMARLIALTHHEKWDGTGYPRGLRGEAIPWEGQIASVCDVFDALTTRRPYKRAWTAAEAVEEIRSQAGRHFNPRMVEAFLQVFPEMERIRKETAD